MQHAGEFWRRTARGLREENDKLGHRSSDHEVHLGIDHYYASGVYDLGKRQSVTLRPKCPARMSDVEAMRTMSKAARVVLCSERASERRVTKQRRRTVVEIMIIVFKSVAFQDTDILNIPNIPTLFRLM